MSDKDRKEGRSDDSLGVVGAIADVAGSVVDSASDIVEIGHHGVGCAAEGCAGLTAFAILAPAGVAILVHLIG